MKTINFTEARGRFTQLMKEAEENREVIAITRDGHSSVVLMVQEEYDAMIETLHLHSTHANASRIQQGLADFEAIK